MAHINRLSDREIRSLVTKGKPKFIGDGRGLYLRVTGKGAASWFHRVKTNGVIKQKAIGPLSGHSLADARDIADEMNKAVAQGRDPAEVLKPKFDPSALAFKDYAADFIAGKETEHRSLKAHAQWTSTIAAYCGHIADKRPAEITYRDIELLVQQPGLKGKRETASRVLQRVRNILDYAAKREGEPGRFNPALAVRLPKRKPGEVKHFAAAPYADVPAIMAALRLKNSMSALVLRFTILTAARSGNVRSADWSEINEAEATWDIPGSKMKTGKPFRQPLVPEALFVAELARVKAPNSKRIFPGPNGGLISDVAINKQLHAVYPAKVPREDGELTNITAHGFRSSFRDYVAEETEVAGEVAEMALAHVVGDKVEAAYRRGNLFEKRRRLMAVWANYLTPEDAGDNVVGINTAKAG